MNPVTINNKDNMRIKSFLDIYTCINNSYCRYYHGCGFHNPGGYTGFIYVYNMLPVRPLVGEKTIPYGLAMLIVLLSVGLFLIVLDGIIGNSISSFTKDGPKYEENLILKMI